MRKGLTLIIKNEKLICNVYVDGSFICTTEMLQLPLQSSWNKVFIFLFHEISFIMSTVS